MRIFFTWTVLIALTIAGATAENPLSISILNIERVSESYTYLLLSVENKSNQRFEGTSWSCVFFNVGTPVFENQTAVLNVPPHDRAIKRAVQSYGGPFDKVECRFMRSLPKF